MYKKITLAILSLIISASVILTPTLSAFAFGSLSFDDADVANFYWNGNIVKSTKNYPGYHIRWADGSEICVKMNLVSPSNYVSSSIISLPVAINNMKYFFVVKALSGPSVNITTSPSTYSSLGATQDCYCYLSAEYKNTSGDISHTSHDNAKSLVGSWDDNHDFKNNIIWLSGRMSSIVPILIYFNSYLYIVIPVYGYLGSYANSSKSFVQYESVRYSELHADELAAIGDFDSRFDDAENIGGIGEGAYDELTEPAVDAESESERQSETFSKIDEMISNIDDFASIASSNQADVSSNLADVRSGLDMATGWMPWYFKAIIILGLIVIVAVKVMGR